MKYVTFYDVLEGAEALMQEHFPAHQARLLAFHERGSLLMVGPFTDLPRGAMAVFASREAAEEFLSDDPFVVHGVAQAHLREWNEVLAP